MAHRRPDPVNHSPRRSAKYVIGMLLAVLLQGTGAGLFLYPWVKYPAIVGYGLVFIGVTITMIVNIIWRD